MTSETSLDPMPVGSLLRGRFELLEVVGRGGASTVYRACDRMRLLGRAPEAEAEVAVKIVATRGEMREWAIERIHREARHLRDLAHPNIVRVFDSDRDGTLHYLVLELLRGRTVGRILSDMPQKRLPADIVQRIVTGAAAGLSFAHGRGIIHADLKPNNLFITNDGDVKLLDFGAARTLEAEASVIAGAEHFDAITPIYASCETLEGEPPAETDDVYSLAVLAYVMTAGAHPFDGTTALEARRLNLHPGKPAHLAQSRWRALARGLSLQQHRRTASIAAFAADFAQPRWWARWLG